MSDYSGGGPVFVDMYGTSRRLGLEEPGSGGDGGDGKHGFEGPHPDGPFWKRGLKGRLPLWMAFWGGFFFGHGILIAFSVGVILMGTVLGLTMGSGIISESTVTAVLMGGAIAIVCTLFALWAVISVWRCAVNAKEKKWAYAARAMMVAYVAVWGTSIWNVLN